MLKEAIAQLAKDVHQTVINNRRYLHAHPELSFQEHQTAAFVKARLSELGIPWNAVAGTGVVALIKGELPCNRVVALRADMDALPITETNTVDYASQYKGVMHACGHDAHTSSLLGTAAILYSLKSKFGGTVKLIFQPGEEKLPGGASLMIKEGVLDNPKPNVVIGQHVMPSIECGKIGIRKGKLMASMDELLVTVRGKGGHGAQPHQNIDPVLIASHIIIALQQIVSRIANPNNPTVLSFGKVVADGAINIIPDTVRMEGTFRTLNEQWRSEAHVQMKKIAEGIAESMGGSCAFMINRGYPFLINEEKLTEAVRLFAGAYLGEENIIDVDTWMASEDFACYSQLADSCFYFLGVGNAQKKIHSALHTPAFNIDENALALSTGLMAYIAVRQLGFAAETI
ncbi:M20 family metallopeptidase [Agriterribacter sp.]|uniref:M20 metallopeptidase family protein n=1 Tax=Agriterribacter sp. TaxID=2821509 RepID=UPI002D1606A7|nr:M20 family metallopeptidase [Agriterribacter sp.]HTN08301.1 M20 family metallopeptidase [Agriterribacter sp.]